MSDKFVFSSAGLTHELEMAMDRAGGWSPTLVKRMCEGDRLVHIREYLLGLAEIRHPEHLIDCDTAPFIPQNWQVEEHQKGGFFKWNSAEVKFYLSEPQRQDKVIEGNKLRQELADKPVLNANVLDYLLAHPHLIPEEWKRDEKGCVRGILFLGTTYRGPSNRLFVRLLYWNNREWIWTGCWLGSDLSEYGLAALRVDVPTKVAM